MTDIELFAKNIVMSKNNYCHEEGMIGEREKAGILETWKGKGSEEPDLCCCLKWRLFSVDNVEPLKLFAFHYKFTIRSGCLSVEMDRQWRPEDTSGCCIFFWVRNYED